MVYVISKSGKPLMPTRRHGKVRRLLKSMIVKPAKRTYLAHKYGLVSDIHTGDTVKGNVKQNVFVATGIRILSSQVIIKRIVYVIQK